MSKEAVEFLKRMIRIRSVNPPGNEREVAQAIAHMSNILHALFNDFKMSYDSAPLLGGPTFSVDVIEGGVKTNVVPDRCRIEIDFRTVPSLS